MRNHSNSAHLQAVSSALLMAMAADDDAAREIGEEGGVQDVLAALRAYPNDPVVGVVEGGEGDVSRAGRCCRWWGG